MMCRIVRHGWEALFQLPLRTPQLNASKCVIAAIAVIASTATFAADFKSADTDKDGTLDRKEAAAVPFVAKNFDAIDTDKDGTIDAKELAAYYAVK
jgi:hypothetical protein